MYTPSARSVKNRWYQFNGLTTTADILSKRHYALPEQGCATTAIIEFGKGTRKSSSVERKLCEFLTSKGYEVDRYSRISACAEPFTVDGIPIHLSPDLLVNERVVVEVDVPAELGGGPTHNFGFPARDMVRMDFFRAAGLDTVSVRLFGLDEIPDHISIMDNGGLGVSTMESVNTELARLLSAWDST